MILQAQRQQVETALAGRLSILAGLLARPVDVSSLATFRFLFGALMVWEVGRYFSLGYISRYYIEPQFYFTYEFFPFVGPLPGQGMYWLFLAMGLFALGLALGFYYKLSTLLFLLSYTYVFLLDKTPYNNHYYLIILLSFLLLLADAQRWASIDRWRAASPGPETIPFWQLFILRAQLFIVYFYGGIAKLNSDWLMGEPMRIWLAERTGYPLLGPFLATEWAVYFFSYGGLLFDLSIGFLLLWPRTRLLAFSGLLFFHMTNNWLFSIGVFPFLALASTILFIEPDRPRRALRFLHRHVLSLRSRNADQPSVKGINTQFSTCAAAGQSPGGSRLPLASPHQNQLNAWTFGFVLFFLALQILIPLRHWLYPGNASWTEEGHRFSWHMKLRDKETRLEFIITNPHTGQTWKADLTQDLTGDQIGKMAARPDMILQYAYYLKGKLQQNGLDRPVITANAWASLNGRPFRQLVDPAVNMADIQPTLLAPASWILPLKESLTRPREPVLYTLAVVTMLLANLGLTWSIYSAVSAIRAARMEFALNPSGFDKGESAAQTLTLTPHQFLGLVKILGSLLPNLAILLSLAAWVVSRQPLYLGVALTAALMITAWGLYLPTRLSQWFDRSFFRWGLAFLGALTGLFICMQIIIIGPT